MCQPEKDNGMILAKFTVLFDKQFVFVLKNLRSERDLKQETDALLKGETITGPETTQAEDQQKKKELWALARDQLKSKPRSKIKSKNFLFLIQESLLKLVLSDMNLHNVSYFNVETGASSNGRRVIQLQWVPLLRLYS